MFTPQSLAVWLLSLLLYRSHSVLCISDMVTAKQWKSFSHYITTTLWHQKLLITTTWRLSSLALTKPPSPGLPSSWMEASSRVFCCNTVSYFMCYKLIFLTHSINGSVLQLPAVVPKTMSFLVVDEHILSVVFRSFRSPAQICFLNFRPVYPIFPICHSLMLHYGSFQSSPWFLLGHCLCEC